jgi:hypothetical protein
VDLRLLCESWSLGVLSGHKVLDEANYDYVFELIRKKEAILKRVKRDHERGVTTFDEYVTSSRAIIQGIDELRGLLRSAKSQ